MSCGVYPIELWVYPIELRVYPIGCEARPNELCVGGGGLHPTELRGAPGGDGWAAAPDDLGGLFQPWRF